jgi:hypothetical protein
MKKLFIVIIICLVIIVGLIGYYYWDNSESIVRKRIQNSFYKEMSYEGCELNNYQNFPSKNSCLNAINCVSKEISEMIRDDELSVYNRQIKAKNSIEVMVFESLGSSYQTTGRVGECLRVSGWTG